MIQIILSLITLVCLELVMCIDNLIFVNIIIDAAQEKAKHKLRVLWAILGVISRSILLFCINWLLSQKGKPIFTIFDNSFDLSSLVMIAGGVFLIYKTVLEIHENFEKHEIQNTKKIPSSFSKALIQIFLVDIVFSFENVITACGTSKTLWVMITAVIIAMITMFYFSELIANYVRKQPTMKILVLAFLVMIGFTLVIEGFNQHIAEELNIKNYVYFAMIFALSVEIINIKLKKKTNK